MYVRDVVLLILVGVTSSLATFSVTKCWDNGNRENVYVSDIEGMSHFHMYRTETTRKVTHSPSCPCMRGS